MISVIDFDYNLLYVNRNMAETFGVDRDNAIGKKCYKAIRGLNKPCTICQLSMLLPDKDKYPFIDYDSVLDETSATYIGGRAAIIRWIDGAQVFFNSVKDETIKIKYQEQLREATVAAKSASVAKSAFLANMSHEIRTPMNSIIGFSELALDSEMTPTAREYLDMIRNNAKGLLEIINDILDISKVESGHIILERIPFDLQELLNSCKNIIMPRAAEKNIELSLETEPINNKKVIGDPTRLRQVLTNLLSNAVKFTDSGSVSLAISVTGKTDSNVMLKFKVKDTGIGMTDEQIKKIFDPFTQADVSTTRKYGGTGLGMTISKNILNLMSSKLTVESEPGAGTTISFDLMLDTIDSTDLPATDSSIMEELEKPEFIGDILVCEDNQMNQRVITDHLTKLGLNVEIAENGQEGINKVRTRMENGIKPFDLILMDIHMPVMDGIEATPKIIQLGTGTPVVAMTANIMTGDRVLYKTLGINDYIGKPFTSQELWRTLLKYLKPIGFMDVSDEDLKKSRKEGSDTKLQIELKIDFVKTNQYRFVELKTAILSGDIKTAHRLAHTIKSNAALIDKTKLKEIAAEIEAALINGESHVTEEQMIVLQRELSAVLDELSPYLSVRTASPDPDSAFDVDEARKLLEKLEPLLLSGNTESLKMIDDLRAIPGSGELIRQIDDFSFIAAAKTLSELKEKLK